MSKFTLSDSKKILTLPLPPEITTNIRGEFAMNMVLDRHNPQVRSKSSAASYSVPVILLISDGLQVNQQPILDTLSLWAKNQTRLSLKYNSHSIPICYIQNLTVTVKQYRSGKPVHAEVSLDLLESSAVPKPTKTAPISPKKITPNEQQKRQQKIQQKLNPVKLSLLGLTGEVSIAVSEEQEVSLTDSTGNAQTLDYAELMERLT